MFFSSLLLLFFFGVVCSFHAPPSLRSALNDQRTVARYAKNVENDEKVSALVNEDEWLALRLELTEAVKNAIKEEDNMIDSGVDIEKAVEAEIARLRGKTSYETGDLSAALGALTSIAIKEMADKAGSDLDKTQKELDIISARVESQVTNAIQNFTGKENASINDISIEIDRRVKERVAEFTGSEDYEFGDISKEIEIRRRAWVQDFLGAEAASKYQFGDITKEAIRKFTGKDEYKFGDISRKLTDNVFKNKEAPSIPQDVQQSAKSNTKNSDNDDSVTTK